MKRCIYSGLRTHTNNNGENLFPPAMRLRNEEKALRADVKITSLALALVDTKGEGWCRAVTGAGGGGGGGGGRW